MSKGAPSGTVNVRAWPDADAAAPPAVNVGDGERLLTALAGGLLILNGVKRLSLSGLVLTALGGAFAYRAASGHCVAYERLGIDTSVAGLGSVPGKDTT